MRAYVKYSHAKTALYVYVMLIVLFDFYKYNPSPPGTEQRGRNMFNDGSLSPEMQHKRAEGDSNHTSDVLKNCSAEIIGYFWYVDDIYVSLAGDYSGCLKPNL